jgi:hypothetical protein
VSVRCEPLRKAFPGAGAYLNEADYLEADWQSVFWGTNYKRLQAAKALFDPLGLFSGHHCVELPPGGGGTSSVQTNTVPLFGGGGFGRRHLLQQPLSPLQQLGISC